MRAITFAAVGTCGQRCTTLRRLIVHESVAENWSTRLKRDLRAALPIGDPRHEARSSARSSTEAGMAMQQGIAEAGGPGGPRVRRRPRVKEGGVPPGGYLRRPAIVEIGPDAPIVRA